MSIKTTSALVLTLVAAHACGSGGEDGDSNDAGANDVGGTPDAAIDANLDPFSFFVASYATMQLQSGSVDGFGGNFGGLAGADQICQTAAANVGFGHRTWRAFLSVTDDGNGSPVHAIDRIGTGPWYDRAGRLIANDIAGLLQERPAGDAQAVADMIDENGSPLSDLGNAHDIVTGSDQQGRVAGNNLTDTCQDWTSDQPGPDFTVMGGHSYPRNPNDGRHWMSDHPLRGCTPGVNFVQNGPGNPEDTCIGCSGGYGGIYCFALSQ